MPTRIASERCLLGFGLTVLLSACLPPDNPKATPAPPTIALENARLIDGTGAPPLLGRTVLVNAGQIAAVFEGGSQELPGHVVRVDLTGQTLLPGLIEGHVHLRLNPEKNPLPALLRSGVTTLRDMGGDGKVLRELASRALRTESGLPTMHFSATFFGPPHLKDPRIIESATSYPAGEAPWARVVTAESDLTAFMRAARTVGVTGAKLYASLDADMLAKLGSAARAEGLKIWTHSVVFPANVGDAVAAGAHTIVHAKGMISLGRRDLPDNFAEGVGTWVRQQDFTGVDPASPPYQALYGEMVRRGVILAPALTADGDRAKRPLPPWVAQMRDWACRATAAAHRAGVVVSAGTDGKGVPGEIQQEIARLVECGLTPLEAIRAATLSNARDIGIEATHGSIETGKVADLIAVAGDPATDIKALSDIRMVMKQGTIVTRSRYEVQGTQQNVE